LGRSGIANFKEFRKHKLANIGRLFEGRKTEANLAKNRIQKAEEKIQKLEQDLENHEQNSGDHEQALEEHEQALEGHKQLNAKSMN
jgi:chromosome segregation ATPase